MKKSITIFGILLGLIALGIAYYGYKLHKELGYSQNTQTDIKTTITTQPTAEKPSRTLKTEALEEIKNKTTGCIAAFTPVDENYTKSKNISDQTKKLLDQYRKNWQSLCRGQEGFTLNLLWNEAEELTRLEHKDAQGHSESDLCDRGEDGECYPIMLFTPGIAGLHAEGMLLGFAPSQELFAENLVLGNQEDKDFFTTYTSLGFDNSNNFYPWIDQTWDYGGCTKYGNYDWTKTLNILNALSKKVTGTAYRENISASTNDLIDGVTDNLLDHDFEYKGQHAFTPHICSCDKKEAVLSDMEKVLEYAKSHPLNLKDGTAVSSRISEIITHIKNGKVDVLSQAERHCSGG